jgi:hypothetical protein
MAATRSRAVETILVCFLICFLSVCHAVIQPVKTFNYYMASQHINLSGNLATGKRSFQSSVRNNGSPERGNDGLVGQNYWKDETCINTAESSLGEWWTVDLGDNSTVVKVVKLFNRLDSDKAKDLKGVEVRVGNISVSGNGNQNPLCTHDGPEYINEYPGETPFYPTLFRCDNSVGRFVTIRLATGKQLMICEAMVFSEEKEDQWIIKPNLVDDGAGGLQCPPPLLDTCKEHEANGMDTDDAAVKAFMEGPIDCGDRGFFCRMIKDPAGKNGGMTGGPSDDSVGNENFGYW